MGGKAAEATYEDHFGPANWAFWLGKDLVVGVNNIRFRGGCDGNLKAIGKLLEGADASFAIEKLKGNDCGGRGTSCADQLTKAIEQALAEQAG